MSVFACTSEVNCERIVERMDTKLVSSYSIFTKFIHLEVRIFIYLFFFFFQFLKLIKCAILEAAVRFLLNTTEELHA